jgi:general secretion pathway protein G
MRRADARGEAGFSLVGAAAGITIMLTLMGMAMPAWKYVMQDDREEELLYRGAAIVDAITRYQKENKNLPVSLDNLVKRKYLRKAYTDPMTKDGKWRFIFPGEPALAKVGGGVRPLPGPGGMADGRGRPGMQSRPGPGGDTIGPFMGVASTSTATSLRLLNGRSKYDEWIFAVGMPMVIGKPPVNMPGMEASPSPRPPGSSGPPRR